MSVSRRAADLSYRLYGRIRHRDAASIAEGTAQARDFEHLHGHKYALLVSYRRSGEGVPTPVWFGLADGKLYFRTERRLAKVKRIAANRRVRVAPCTLRGKPLGPAVEGEARILSGDEEERRAEAALQANYGLGRRIYETPQEPLGLAGHYVEVTPTG